MVKDEELERIKLKKMKEMREHRVSHNMPDSLEERKEENKPIKVTDSTFMEIVHKYALVVIEKERSACSKWSLHNQPLQACLHAKVSQ